MVEVTDFHGFSLCITDVTLLHCYYIFFPVCPFSGPIFTTQQIIHVVFNAFMVFVIHR